MDVTNKEVLEAAARLLVDIAGPAPVHIEMSRTGPKKYYSVARALTLSDASQHLRGIKTRGALCSRPDGQTRALAYDADERGAWERLREAARQLAVMGYRPLLELSPRGRGGHLWLIFTTFVDVQAARHHAHGIAPDLDRFPEFWPGPSGATSWNRVRLPGGRYVAPGFAAWCKLYSADGKELSRDGMGAARVLLDEQTPADLIPALPPDPQRDCDVKLAVTNSGQPAKCDSWPAVTKEGEAPTNVEPSPKRYSPALRNGVEPSRYLWFQYSAAQLVEWFNERHTLEELHPTECGRHGRGMAFSPSVSERTPSTGYYETEDGQRWTDFSAGARRSDGRPDGGDALELYVRLQGGNKAAVLSGLGREMVQEARQELEAAARCGAQPPLWVEQMMTPTGWRHYRIAARAYSQHQEQQISDQEKQH